MDLEQYFSMAKPFFKSLFKKKTSKLTLFLGAGHPGDQEDTGRQVQRLPETAPSEVTSHPDTCPRIRYKEKMHAAPSEWRLTEIHSGRCMPLPRTMLFLGRDDCDINIPSRSVDKRHAVLTYDGYEEKFRVKDLSSVNGTYVNDSRLTEQEYVTLEDMDTLHFGFDPMVYRMERIDELPHLEQQHETPPSKVMAPGVKVTRKVISPRASPPPLVTSPAELPHWAVREPSPRPAPPPPLGLAECQGCIVEQGIRHTCGGHEDHVEDIHNHHCRPHQSHRSTTVYVSSNGHTAAPPSHDHPSSINRWKDAQVVRHRHANYSQHSSSVDHSTTHVEKSGVSYSRQRNFRTSAQLQVGETVTCQTDVTSPTRDYRRCSDGRSPTSPASPPPLVINEGIVHPLVDERELAVSQHINQNEEGNVEICPSQSLPSDTATFTVENPQDQSEEQFQTHFQIIPPRQGQNYRVINVHFTAPPNLGTGQSERQTPTTDTPASGPCQNAKNSSLGHFVLMTPALDEGISGGVVGEAMPELRTLQQEKHLSPGDHQQPHTGVRLGAGEHFPVSGHNTDQVAHCGQRQPMVTIRDNVTDITPVKGSSRQMTNSTHVASPSSPPSLRHDQRRSLAGTEPELETIKKCTPLYGQPSWWGEQTELEHSSHQSTTPTPSTETFSDDEKQKSSSTNGTVRPSSLALENSSQKPANSVNMNKYKTQPHYGATYMEIPQRDDSSKKHSDHTPVAAGADVSHTPPEKDVGPVKPAAEKAGPMAFTVDLGDDMGGAPKLNMKNSLSEFLPPNVRRSFRSRSVKSRTRSRDDKEDSPASSKASRDGSPVGGSTSSPQYHSDGGHNSALSSDNEDISTRSDNITTKSQRQSTPSFSTATFTRRPRRDKSAGRTSNIQTADLQTQQTSLTTTEVGTVDSKNYLIERMFNQPIRQALQTDQTTGPDQVFVENTRTCEAPTTDGSSSHTNHSPARKAAIPPTSLVAPRRRELSETSDNISESGTYTIEGEGTELKRARQSIDAVFGVTDPAEEDVHINGQLTGPTIQNKKLSGKLSARSDPVSCDVTSASKEVDEEPQRVVDEAKEDTPKWVSQWATLATHKTFVKSPTLTTQAPIHVAYGEAPDTKSSSESGVSSHKHRGTGRKLPTPPVKSSSTTPLSPRSTTDPSSGIFSPRESTLSETPERHLDIAAPSATVKPATYVDPRPEAKSKAIDDINEMLTNSGVTSDVVTFVHDEMPAELQSNLTDSVKSEMTDSVLTQMTDSVHTEMTDSMISSRVTESLLGEEHGSQDSGEQEEQELQQLANNYRDHHSPNPVRPCAAIINTQVLLQDTADVVQAMTDRVLSVKDDQESRAHELPNRKSTELFIPLHDDESDSEGSLKGIVNGHRREMPKFKPKPKLFKSHSSDTRKPPRPFLTREEREKEREPPTKEIKESRTTPVRGSPKPRTSSSKPRTSQTIQNPPKIPKDATFVKTDPGSSRSTKQRLPSLDLNSSFGSDLHSESETGSILSTSTDYSESLSPKLGRRGSKGKGPMSMTRPNRAFALRRARLEGEPEPPPPRSQTNTPRSRPSSAGARDTPRSRPSSARDNLRSDRTDISSGAKNVYKSRESSVGPPRAKSAGPRTDMGRLTARHEKKSTGGSSTPRKSPAPPSTPRNKPERISISNPAVSGTRSKPTSRSNSPQTPNAKSDEYSAWKRRKTYDPRQAVVNAKAKAREQKKMKSVPDRSLSAGPHSRTSTVSSLSSEDTSYLEEGYSHEQDAIRQVGSSLSHQVDAMSRSIENDEAFMDSRKLGSSQQSLRSGLSNRSAFSVPRSKSVPQSLRSPPPPRSPRRLSSGLLNSASGAYARRVQTVSAPQRLESYDSVMVNSIYQLSLKVRKQTDRLMDKMRKDSLLEGSPSPPDETHSPPLESEIPGYKNANQELVGILRNLRTTERHLYVMDKALFPGQGGGASPASPQDHQQYLRELERIRTEISGFRPIGDDPSSSSRSSWRRTSHDSDATDVEGGDPLASDEYY